VDQVPNVVQLRSGRIVGLEARIGWAFPITELLQVEGADRRVELPRVKAVPVALTTLGLLAGLWLRVLGHLGAQDRAEDRSEQRRQSLLRARSWILLSSIVIPKVAIARMSAGGCLVTFPV